MSFLVPGNLTNVVELLPFASDVTGGLLGIAMLIVIGMGTFIITSTFNSRDSFLVTGFVLWVSSFFLVTLDLISWNVLLIVSVILVIVALAASSKGGGA